MHNSDDQQLMTLSMTLSMDRAKRKVTIHSPAEEVRPLDLLPVIQDFEDEVVALSAEAATLEGKSISCRAGCGACCRQLVPISEIEAHNLARVVAAMPRQRRREVQRRFDRALKGLRKSGLLERLERAREGADDDELQALGLEYFRLGIPCPFLEEESCGIHPDRPLSCREFLVTSPAENCSNPGPDNIEVVPLPGKPSRLLFRFSDGVGAQPNRWMVMSLALEWQGMHRDDPQPSRPGHLMMQDFLRRLGDSGSEGD